MLTVKKDIRPIIIFSVELSGLTKEQNSQRTENFKQDLEQLGIPYRPAVGSYKGQLENSFIIEKNNFPEIRDAVFNTYGQESVLEVGISDTGFLIYPEANRKDYIGGLRAKSISYALKHYNAFTIAGNKAYVFV